MKAWGNFRDAAFDFTNYHLNRKSENNRTCLKPTTQKTHALWSKSRKHLPIGFKKRPQLPGPIASSTSEKKSKLSWDRWRISGGDRRLQSWSNTQTSTTLRGSSRAWRLYMVPLPMPWLLSHLLMEPCLQGSLISFKVGVKSLANFSTDRPVSHPRYASAPGSKLSWRSPNTEGNPEKIISSSRLGKHLLLMRYLQKSLRREERSSPSSSLSWCSSFGSRAQCLGTSRTPTPSTCTRTKMTEHPVTTTVQRHLAVEYSRKDHGMHHTKLYHTPPPGWFSSPRVSVQEKQRDNGHNIPRRKDQGKVPRAESEPVHPLCAPDQGLWYGLLVGWTCGLNGRHALPEDVLLLWGRQRCT